MNIRTLHKSIHLNGLLTIALSILLLSSCEKGQKVRISGELTNSITSNIYLAEFDLVTNKIIDSVEINKNGKFTFKVTSTEPRFYQLMLSNSNFILLLAAPDDKIKIKADAANLSANYTIEGSKLSQDVQLLTKHLNASKFALDSLTKIALAAQGKTNYTSILAKLDSQYNAVIKEQRKFSIQFIIQNLTSMASIVALYQKYDDGNYVLNSNRDLQYIKLVSDSLQKYYPESKVVKTLYSDRTRLLSEFNKLKLASTLGSANTAIFPEIELPNLNGDMIKLSETKGKLIVLNFWDPTNEDCLYVLKGLKEIYGKYHNKGLEIYNVALMKNIQEWRAIVNKYDLAGIHTIDPQVYKSYATKVYNVEKLPATYLLDNTGILAKDLFGEALEKQVKTTLK